MVLSAIAPDTIVADVAQNTVWKIMNTPIGSPLNMPSASASDFGLKKPAVPIKALLPPNISANPMIKKKIEPSTKSIMFFIRMFPEFFALVNPVSTMANPACIKYTRKAPTMVHTILSNTCVFSIISSSSFPSYLFPSADLLKRWLSDFLKCLFAVLTCPDPHCIFDIVNENFSIAVVSG